MKTFKHKGYLFGVSDDGKLSVFVPNFDKQYGINGLSGFWKTLGTVAAVAGAGYAAYSVATAPGETIGAKVTSAISTMGTQLSNLMPSADTIKSAGSIAASILGAKVAQQAGQLYPGQMSDQFGVPTGDVTGQPGGMIPPGYKPSMDTTTMLLIGGGLLVVFMMLKGK